MATNHGRSPSGSDQSAKPEPVSRLGHTATVPNAFTPGPWRYVPSIWANGHRCILDVNDVAIAHTIDRGNGDANARLIKAAPGLYEAVEALVECFIRRGPFDEPLGSSEQAPSINAGIAALAKANPSGAAQ